MTEESGYREALTMIVAHFASRCASFSELLEYVPGLYPGDVAAVLADLAARQLVDAETHRRLAPAADPAGRRGNRMPGGLPDPHPLDFDWRFTGETVAALLEQCLRLTEEGDRIALLGTPSLFAAAAQHDHRREFVLLEQSRMTVAALRESGRGRVIHCDLGDEDIPDLGASLAVADPPWYAADTRLFLRAAALLTAPGAQVLLAQPSVGTRPGVLAEREELIAWASDAGLRSVAVDAGALGYTAPPFELESLAAIGLGGVPATWRCGDLLRFAAHGLERPIPRQPKTGAETVWHEVASHGVRIRFRDLGVDDEAGTGDPRLVSLVPGDVLRTVSLRDPVRASAAVWTSGNRIFDCADPRLLAVIAGAVAADEEVDDAVRRARPETAVDHAAVDVATRQIRDLIALETADPDLMALR